jgi:alkylation response protein AidB-like acyl-CoA dehydrogenase
VEYNLTPEQALFRDTTRDFLEKEAPLTKVRELSAGPVGFDPGWWRRGAELGWTSMLVAAPMGGGSPYVSGGAGAAGARRDAPASALTELVRRTGQASDPRARELVAESHLLSRVQEQLIDRVVAGMAANQLPPTAGSIIRLFSGVSAVRRAEISLDLAGAEAAVNPSVGVKYLSRQSSCLGGGSTEMARNIISERILGMPREYAADRDVPFSQVRQGR